MLRGTRGLPLAPVLCFATTILLLCGSSAVRAEKEQCFGVYQGSLSKEDDAVLQPFVTRRSENEVCLLSNHAARAALAGLPQFEWADGYYINGELPVHVCRRSASAHVCGEQLSLSADFLIFFSSHFSDVVVAEGTIGRSEAINSTEEREHLVNSSPKTTKAAFLSTYVIELEDRDMHLETCMGGACARQIKTMVAKQGVKMSTTRLVMDTSRATWQRARELASRALSSSGAPEETGPPWAIESPPVKPADSERFDYWRDYEHTRELMLKTALSELLTRMEQREQQPIVDAHNLESLYREYADELISLRGEAETFHKLLEIACPYFQLQDLEPELTYLRIRDRKPTAVFEASPCCGWSSWWILQALAKNNAGALHSFDLDDKSQGGHMPGVLRQRWTFHKGDMYQSIARGREEGTLPESGFDYYFIDSDHSAEFAQRYTSEILSRDRGTDLAGSVHDIWHAPFPSDEGLVFMDWLQNERWESLDVFDVSHHRDAALLAHLLDVRQELGISSGAGDALGVERSSAASHSMVFFDGVLLGSDEL